MSDERIEIDAGNQSNATAFPDRQAALKQQLDEQSARYSALSNKIVLYALPVFFAVLLIVVGVSRTYGVSSSYLQLDNIPEEASIEQLDRSVFDGATEVACDKGRPTEVAIMQLARIGMRSDIEVVRVATKPVKFADEIGYVAGAEIRWRPGDPGIRFTRTDYFLIDQKCRARMWRSGPERQD